MKRLTYLKDRPNAILGLVLLGMALLAVLARLSVPETKMPEGWVVIRPPVEISDLAVQGGVLWAGGRDGLVSVDRATYQVSPPPGQAPDFRYVKGLLVDRRDALWVAHAEGVSRYDGRDWSSVPEANDLLGGPATALWEDRQGTIWVGGEKGVVKLAPGRPRLLTVSDGLAAPSVDVIFEDREGTMWFGSASPTHGGLASFDGTAWRSYSTREGLAHNSINAIIQDRTGALWLACGFHDRGGASRLADGVWTSLYRKDGLAGEKVRSIFEDREGRLWFGSEYDGVAIYDGAKWRILTPVEGLASWEVKKIVQDPEGVFWLGTLDGLSRIPSLD